MRKMTRNIIGIGIFIVSLLFINVNFSYSQNLPWTPFTPEQVFDQEAMNDYLKKVITERYKLDLDAYGPFALVAPAIDNEGEVLSMVGECQEQNINRAIKLGETHKVEICIQNVQEALQKTREIFVRWQVYMYTINEFYPDRLNESITEMNKCLDELIDSLIKGKFVTGSINDFREALHKSAGWLNKDIADRINECIKAK